MEIRSTEYNPFEPKHFLTVYSNGQQTIMELGDFVKVDGKYKVGASRPADMEFLNDLADSIKKENFTALSFSGLTPENVWYHHSASNEPTIVWMRPAGTSYLHFKDEVGESGVYHLPPMLFVAHRGELYVYRMTGEEKSIDRQLYMVPLPNIYDDCKVCLGSNELPEADDLEGYMHNMEALFFNTRFNALHHEKFGEGIIYVELLKQKNIDLFPLEISENETLKDLLDELT